MKIQVRRRGLLSLMLSLLLVLGMFASVAEPVHAEDNYDISSFEVSFDEEFRVLDDIESTIYPDYFYVVTAGRVLELDVFDTEGFRVDNEYYTASYCECQFNEEKNEWEKIDENNWLDEFPTTPGVYFCKVAGVEPYYGTFEQLDLIKVQERQKYDLPTDYKEIDLSDVDADGWYKSNEEGEDMGVPCYSYKLPAEKKQWVRFRVASDRILVDRPITSTWVRLLDSEGYEVDWLRYDAFVTYPAVSGETYYLYAESNNTQEDEYIMVSDTPEVRFGNGNLGSWKYEKTASGVANPVDGTDGWKKYTVGELDGSYVWKNSGETEEHWYYYRAYLNIISNVPVQYYNPRLEANFGTYQTVYKNSLLSEEEEDLTLADGEKNYKVNYTFNITDYSATAKRESQCKIDVYIPVGYMLYVDNNGYLHVKKDDGSEDNPPVVDPCEKGHSFSGWTTTVAATEISAGVQTGKCSVCGAVGTRPIAQLAPTLPAVKISGPKAAKKSATVKWKKVSSKNLKKVKKIEIQYSLDRNFKTGVMTKYAGAKKTSLKIKGLKSKKTYYVRVRAYTKAGSVVHVSKWSSTKKAKAK